MADFYASTAMPGPSAVTLTDERWALFGGVTWYYLKGITIKGAATADPFNTPTTDLRHGLLMGQRNSDGYFANYVPSAVDGTGLCAGFLFEARSTLDTDNLTVDRPGQLVLNGPVKAAILAAINSTNFDEQSRRQLQGKMIFDDRMVGVLGGFRQTLAKPSGYTVVNGQDNDTIFTTTGAIGTVPFVLGTPARGNRFRFANTVNQNMSITAPAGTLIGLNGAAFTSLTFSTASQKIGAMVEITPDDTGNFWMAWLLTTATASFA
jgi:hypothetical protein